MEIRQATADDLDEMERIFEAARQTMRESGNASQWAGGYPQRPLILDDIARQVSFIVEHDGIPRGTFMFAVEDDPTYAVIHDGAWLNDEPYGVIHRIASDGAVGGVFPFVLDHCRSLAGNIRIDTHRDNAIMRHILEREGFIRCGTILCHDGTPRIAYQIAPGS